jgi:hypothetical protein
MATTRQPPRLPDPEEQAQELAQQLIANLAQSEHLEVFRPFRTSYPFVADVEFAIEELNQILSSARYSGRDILCIQSGQDMVPVVGLPSSYREWSQVFERAKTPFVYNPPSLIPRLVLNPLQKFLTVRFRWVADNPEFRSLGAASSAQANNPYLPFTVHTNTSGLRIHYSKTFAINFNNVFGAPTTPLHGWILSGIHKFAGMDVNGNFHYDPGSFTTPPDFSARLVI